MKISLRSESRFVHRVANVFPSRRSPRDLRADRRKAVQRAYRQFAQRYPRWANSLFDEYFLKHAAQEALTRGLLRPEALADAWTRQLRYRDEARRLQHRRQIMPVAEIFVRLVRAEMV